MLISIAEKVKQFNDTKLSDNDGIDYLKSLRDNMKSLEEKFYKNFITVFLLIAIFILFSKSVVTQISIGPIIVKDVASIYAFLPLILAYKYYEICSVMVMRRLSRVLHLELTKRVNHPVFVSGLEYYLMPYSIFLTNEIVLEGKKGFQKHFIILLLGLCDIATQLGFIGFEIYSLHSIYSVLGTSSAIFWIVSIPSVILMILGYYSLLSKTKELRNYNIK